MCVSPSQRGPTLPPQGASQGQLLRSSWPRSLAGKAGVGGGLMPVAPLQEVLPKPPAWPLSLHQGLKVPQHSGPMPLTPPSCTPGLPWTHLLRCTLRMVCAMVVSLHFPSSMWTSHSFRVREKGVWESGTMGSPCHPLPPSEKALQPLLWVPSRGRWGSGRLQGRAWPAGHANLGGHRLCPTLGGHTSQEAGGWPQNGPRDCLLRRLTWPSLGS